MHDFVKSFWPENLFEKTFGFQNVDALSKQVHDSGRYVGPNCRSEVDLDRINLVSTINLWATYVAHHDEQTRAHQRRT